MTDSFASPPLSPGTAAYLDNMTLDDFLVDGSTGLEADDVIDEETLAWIETLLGESPPVPGEAVGDLGALDLPLDAVAVAVGGTADLPLDEVAGAVGGAVAGAVGGAVADAVTDAGADAVTDAGAGDVGDSAETPIVRPDTKGEDENRKRKCDDTPRKPDLVYLRRKKIRIQGRTDEELLAKEDHSRSLARASRERRREKQKV